MADDSQEMIANNAAGRLLRLVRGIAGRKGREAVTGWRRVLGVPSGNAVDVERLIAKRLMAAHDQVDLVETHLRSRGVRQASYDSTLEKLRGAFSFQLLGGQWGPVKSRVGEPVPAVLAILADLMDAEPESFADDDLDSLRERVSAVRTAVHESDLPEGVRAVLYRHLDAFDQALQEYGLRGDAAFGRAAAEVSEKIAEDVSVFQEFGDRPEVRAVVWLWTQIATRAKRLFLASAVAATLVSGANDLLEFRERMRPLLEKRADEPMMPPLLISAPSDDESVDEAPVDEVPES